MDQNRETGKNPTEEEDSNPKTKHPQPPNGATHLTNDKDLRNARWVDPNSNEKRRTKGAYRHLRHIALLIDCDCMTGLEQIAGEPIVIQQIKVLAIEPQQVSFEGLGQNWVPLLDPAPLETLVNEQVDFVESWKFGRRLGEVLEKLPGCKTIWCGTTGNYPKMSREEVVAERELWRKLRNALPSHLLWRRLGYVEARRIIKS